MDQINRDDYINKLNQYIKNKNQSKAIENSIFNYIIESVSNEIDEDEYELNDIYLSLYEFKFNNILQNINPNSSIKNNYLLYAIKAKKLNLQNIANLENYNLFPDKWNSIINIENENERCKKLISTTDEFRCGNCKQNKCTYVEKQTRSADEPMTLFIECQNCHNRWKQ